MSGEGTTLQSIQLLFKNSKHNPAVVLIEGAQTQNSHDLRVSLIVQFKKCTLLEMLSCASMDLDFQRCVSPLPLL